MHPLAAIGLVFLAGLAWTGTILTLLVALAQTRHRPRVEERPTAQSVKVQSSDE
ncbi:hypothetical protein PUN71_007600 [Arthrobacter sp. NQ7]|uniref:hypothetical protein n=1 Tax=Arthrobacter sp. NQ7 TaxID=3032303 RepID=UPI0024101AB0|nr:hypothetical protein [Arthrobacter sp. NQ7]MDJ0457057.1 hypothetical protein [Arthrobacter sp. NQ7]